MSSRSSPNLHENRWMDHNFLEAHEDFQCLQTMSASLIFRILELQHELEERLQMYDNLPAMDAFRLRHADEVLIALHRIKGDTETLIHNFNRPVKTFIEANLDQSRLISRLSALLPSLQPLLAMPEGDYHSPWPVPDQMGMRHIKEENWSEAKEGLGGRHKYETPDEDRLEKRRVKREYSTGRRNETACFDRGPRSRSIIPSTNAVVDRELRWAAPMSL